MQNAVLFFIQLLSVKFCCLTVRSKNRQIVHSWCCNALLLLLTKSPSKYFRVPFNERGPLFIPANEEKNVLLLDFTALFC